MADIDVDAVLGKLTIQEKVALLSGDCSINQWTVNSSLIRYRYRLLAH